MSYKKIIYIFKFLSDKVNESTELSESKNHTAPNEITQ